MNRPLDRTGPVARRGAAMLMVLVAMIMAVTLGVTFLVSQSPNTSIAQNVSRHAQARLIAESGLTTAIEYLRHSDDWRDTQPEGVWLATQDFGGGNFRVLFEDQDGDLGNNDTDPVKVTVIGEFAGVTHQVSAWVTPGSAGGATPGLLAKHFHSAFYDPFPVNDLNDLGDIDWNREPEHTETVAQINTPSTGGGFYSGGPTDYFGVSYTGYITIPEDGDWTFYTDSDDGSDLWIDGNRIVDNDGLHGMRERSGDIELEAGTYPFRACFFERTGGAGMIVRWRGPGVNKQVIPASAFTFDSEAQDDEPGISPQLLALYEFNEVPIVPNLVGHWRLDEKNSGGVLASSGKIHLKNNSLVDGYDSSAGPYGPGNRNHNAVVATNATSSKRIELENNAELYGSAYAGVGGNPNVVIDTASQATLTGDKSTLAAAIATPSAIAAPTGMPGNEGDYTVSGNQTFSGDRQFDDLSFSNNSVLTIDGDVTVLVNGELAIRNNVEIVLEEDASLTIYVQDDVEISQNVEINNDSTRPRDFVLYVMNGKALSILNNVEMAGTIRASGDVEIKNGVEFYGNLIADGEVVLQQTALLHLDANLPGVGGVYPPVADASGRDSHGTFHNGPSLDRPGAIAATGTSVAFDGTDDYAVIPHHDAYLIDAGALSLWFRTTNRNKTQGIFSKDSQDLDTGGHLSVVIEGGVVRTRLQSTTTDWQWTSSASVQDNTWHHLVFTWGPNKMRLYFDGVEVGQPYDYIGGLGTTAGDIGNYEPIVLGANAWNSDDLSPTPVHSFFEGQIDDVRLYDQALDLTQVGNVRAGGVPGPSSFPGYIVEDTSGFGDPLHLTVQDTDAIAWLDGGGLMFTDDTLARSDDPATKLHDAITATGSFTLEAIFTPDNLTQNGPARIVNVAESSSSRNFMLGQDGDEYVFRLRTTDTSSNGTPDISSPGGLSVSAQHVIITANGEEVRFYRNDNLEHTEARTGSFNWNDSFDLMFGGEADDSRNWRGLLSRVAIYDRALAPSQVDNLFDGLPPGDPEEPGGFNVVWTEQP